VIPSNVLSAMHGFRDNEVLLQLFYILFWLIIAHSEQFRGVFRIKDPQILELHISHPQKRLPYTRPRLLSYFARKLVHGYRLC